MNFRPFEELTKEERQDLAASITGQIQRSQQAANAPEIQYLEKIRIGALYGSNRQPIDRFDYSAYRDKAVWRTIQSKKALLCANDPKPSFLPDTPLDVPLAEVMQHVLVDILDDMNFTLNYTMMVDDELTYGTGFFLFNLCDKSKYKCRLEVVPLAAIGVADWTQVQMKRQPYWYRAGLMSIEEAQEIGGDNIVPTGDISLMAGLKQMFANWWQMSGSDAVKDPLVKKEDAENAFMSGNVYYHEYWVKDSACKPWIAYLINGALVSFKPSQFPCYPLIPYRNKLRNMSFLGVSEAELTKDISDAKSEFLQSMMAQNAAFGKKLVEINEMSGISKTEGEEWLRNPLTVVVTNAETFAQNSSFRIHEFEQGVSTSQMQMFQLFSEILESDSNNTKWLEGAVASGPDPAMKVEALQRAGAAQVKQQAVINDYDGGRRLAEFLLWHIQTNLTEHFIVSVAGEYLPDGTPRFVDVNLDVNKDEMNLLMDAAAHAKQTKFKGKLKYENSVYSPKNIETQIEAIHERIDKNGQVPLNKLNNLAMARFKIDIGDSNDLPYSQSERKMVATALAPGGYVLPEEVREIYKFRTDPATMAKLPIVQQMEAARQQQQMMAQQQVQQEEQQQMQAQMAREQGPHVLPPQPQEQQPVPPQGGIV